MQQGPKTLTSADIEKEKDKLDLLPAVEFVHSHIAQFRAAREKLQMRQPTSYAQGWSEEIATPFSENITGPQISPQDVHRVLARMPDALMHLSQLKEVSYQYANEVPVPEFNPDGSFKGAQWVPYPEFGKGGEHPTRILAGYTTYTGNSIYPTAIPETVARDKESAEIYQMHVLMHEFFHSGEFPLRTNPEGRAKIVLETDGRRFSFQQWWEQFEELLLSGAEQPVSRYAATYEKKLNQTTRRVNPDSYLTAIEEQMCETFVAYQLNIISNDEGWTDFKQARPEAWKLMDTLCRAKLIREDGNIDAL